MTVKQVVVLKPYSYKVREVEVARLNDADSVLLKVTVGGICGSDMHIIHGANPFATYPRVIGHEFAGIIEESGANVKGFSKGDRVCVNPTVSCGACASCLQDRKNICLNLNVLGVHRDGGFTQYLQVHKDNLFHYPVELPFALASMVEPYSIAANVLSRMNLAEGKIKSCLVFGAGVIGLVVLDYALALGAEVTMVDITDAKLEFARRMGARYVINSKTENVEERVEKLSSGFGFPFLVDAVGLPALFPLMLKIAASGGVVGLLGFLAEAVPVAELEIVKKELTIVGSRLNNGKFPDVINYMRNGQLHPEEIVSHRFTIDEFPEAVSLVESQAEGVRKVLIDFQS